MRKMTTEAVKNGLLAPINAEERSSLPVKRLCFAETEKLRAIDNVERSGTNGASFAQNSMANLSMGHFARSIDRLQADEGGRGVALLRADRASVCRHEREPRES